MNMHRDSAGWMKIISRIRFLLLVFLPAFLSFAPSSRADVTILLEEPYSYDGALAGTGHAAVYLSHICAASPTELRRCSPGEFGVVISRYHNVGGRDWIAIPLISYLYAVEKPEDIPLIADARLEAALRDRYRRAYLESVAPDAPGGATPTGNWYELVGSAYDRTLYGFQIETTPEKDDEFIAHYNSAPNEESYKLVTRNCADFVRNVVNFYYPKAVGRSLIADWNVATPKHTAKSLVKYSHHHPELHFSTFVIPQVPGTIKRSKPIHGLVDSVFKAKKYEVPLLVLNPFVGGSFAVAYFVSGRFDPAHNAKMLDLFGNLENPLTENQRRLHQKSLQEILNAEPVNTEHADGATWRQFASSAQLQLDQTGQPILLGTINGASVQVGISRGNVLSGSAQPELARELLVARLREELRRGAPPKASDSQLSSDLLLLQRLQQTTAAETSSARATLSATNRRSGTR